jgi:uncharacterized radical SAM superfamily protein
MAVALISMLSSGKWYWEVRYKRVVKQVTIGLGFGLVLWQLQALSNLSFLILVEWAPNGNNYANTNFPSYDECIWTLYNNGSVL